MWGIGYREMVGRGTDGVVIQVMKKITRGNMDWCRKLGGGKLTKLDETVEFVRLTTILTLNAGYRDFLPLNPRSQEYFEVTTRYHLTAGIEDGLDRWMPLPDLLV